MTARTSPTVRLAVRAAPGAGVGCCDGVPPEPSGYGDLGGMGIDRVRDAVNSDEQDVRPDDGDEHDRDEHDVPHQHLAEIHHVEERVHADGVECVFAAGGDPLRVEVLLGHPVKHSMTEAANATTPVIQVSVRRPAQAAIQNFPHR
jgi:hypothetical protein